MGGGQDRGVGRLAPSQDIRRFIETGVFQGAPGCAPPGPDQVQPASLDLRLGPRAHRVRASFLAGADASVEERLPDFAMHEIDLSTGAVLEPGCVYLVLLQERARLPADASGVANAKSSIGRLDVFTRLIVDGGVEFDRAPAGYEGPLYAEITPRTFSVLARVGDRLNQLRVRYLGGETTPAPEPPPPSWFGEGAPFSVDLRGAGDAPVGYRARPHSGLIDLGRLDYYDPRAYWDPVWPQHRGRASGIVLDPGAFYILVSNESVSVPPSCAAEMTPFLPVVGEFRVHYAGFFDPGFGHAAAGGVGARGVLEVRCHEAPFALEHGQKVGRLVYEPMRAAPDKLYGGGIGSTYQGQGLRLSKHFQPWR